MDETLTGGCNLVLNLTKTNSYETSLMMSLRLHFRVSRITEHIVGSKSLSLAALMDHGLAA
jgi:hypothetical protein